MNIPLQTTQIKKRTQEAPLCPLLITLLITILKSISTDKVCRRLNFIYMKPEAISLDTSTQHFLREIYPYHCIEQ